MTKLVDSATANAPLALQLHAVLAKIITIPLEQHALNVPLIARSVLPAVAANVWLVTSFLAQLAPPRSVILTAPSAKAIQNAKLAPLVDGVPISP